MRVYECVQPCQGVKPPEGTIPDPPPDPPESENIFWLEINLVSPRVFSLEGSYGSTSEDMRDFSRWYYPSDIILLRKRGDFYYFEQQLIPLQGTMGERSLSWNETTQRLMAVYR